MAQEGQKAQGVVAKVAQIIEVFDNRHQVLRLSQIAASTKLPTSTCHRLLGEMVDAGLLDRRTDGSYKVGRRMWAAAMTTQLQRGVREVAVPYMQDVLQTTGQVVNLFVMEGDSALILERISGSGVGRPLEPAGSKLPLHTTAGGKVLLAHASDELVEKVLGSLTYKTPATITSPQRMREELEQIRKQGWAQSFGEHHANSWGLSVPVHGTTGEIEAALGIVTFAPIKHPNSVLATLQIVSSVISRHMRKKHH